VGGLVTAVGDMIGDRRLLSYGKSIGGWVMLLRGEVHTALEMHDQAVGLAPDPLALAVVLQFSGETRVSEGNLKRARAEIERSYEILRGFHFPQLDCWALARLSEVELAEQRLDRARSAASQALEFGHTFGLGRGLAERALGRVALADRALGEAATRLASAVAAFTAIEARYETACTYLDLAELGCAEGRPETSIGRLKTAHRLFRELGIDVERVGRMRGDAGDYASPSRNVSAPPASGRATSS
jgi:tetratricopeptide (TPR) repeat protein